MKQYFGKTWTSAGELQEGVGVLHVQELRLIWHVTPDYGKNFKIQTFQAAPFKYLILLILKNSY